jgi:(S)-ureidoglycine aminohydrolase
MQHLGFTRSSVQRNHALLTPDSFIRMPLPGYDNATCITHLAPAIGAQFTQFTVEAHANANFGPCAGYASRFVYVLSGSVQLRIGKKTHTLKPGGYAYLPPEQAHHITTGKPARVMVFEKHYQTLPDLALPQAIVANVKNVAASALNGDSALQVRPLLPDHPSFDFAVNTMTFDPGAHLSLVEVHSMEHGLTMLEGGGIYRLGDNWYSVQAGDIIYMAPYCPQWFGALGKTKSVYLIYKDWNRHGLE